ncbi:MAG: PrsW family intramembrane metalloprotease [Clostridia bacterium]|nr:PrsW family intramembrane metalloprotease [Clostridia bacterium]
MENSNEKSLLVANKSGFWKEMFRRHTKDEYREFFSRGLDGKEGINKVYPWLYLRVFGICAALFALFAFVVFMTGMFVENEAIKLFGYPSLVTVGGILLNLPLLFLVYELYPKRDFAFVKLCFVMIVCVAVTDLAVNLGYCVLFPEDEWIGGLWAVFVEEFSKALPALLAIFLLKKKDSMFGFVIGAAVGVGMAISEDIGYIFVASWDGSVDLPSLFAITGLRSFTSFAGHLVWTGFIGWAFAKFRRPLINIKFWLCVLASISLHYVFNFPYASLSFLMMLVAIACGLVIFVMIPKNERKAVFFESCQTLNLGENGEE